MIKKNVTIFEWILDIVVLTVISFIYYLNLPISTPKVIYIPQGSVTKIITHLHNKGLLLSSIDRVSLLFIGMPQHGWIDLQSSRMSRYDFLYQITHSKAALKEITLIPGETTYMFLQLSAKELNLSFETLYKLFLRYAPLKEGVLVPNTYAIPYGISEEGYIKLLLKLSDTQMQTWSKKIFGTYNKKKWFHIVTIASIIEKEASDENDMYYVSSVLYNRLKKGMKLQMDGTLNYGKYSHIKVTSKRIKNDTTNYNTYKNKGLPAYPICNVSFSAIKAAIFPKKTEYLYFVKGKDGHHKYTRYYNTHKRNLRNATK